MAEELDVRRQKEIIEKSVEGIKRTGLRVQEMEIRHAKLRMPLTGNVNHVGIMYAGSLFVLGETCGGVIIRCTFPDGKYYTIVKEVTIRFRRPATTDITATVELSDEDAMRIQEEAEENGKADFPLHLELKNQEGEVVAFVTGIWQIRKAANPI